MTVKQVFLGGALLTALLMLIGCSKTPADFTLTLGGDIMLARNGEEIFNNQGQEINPWLELPKQGIFIESYFDAPDFFFANLESPLGEKASASNNMNLCSDPAQVKVLIGGGVDLVSLANNHRDDCDVNGAAETKTILDHYEIKSASMGEAPVYLEIPGGKMAVIAADDVSGSLDVKALLSEIESANNIAQVVVVSMHWGSEYQAGANEKQQSLAQQIADAGADVIWGHHPHVLQKMEWLESADGRQVLVIYSLGNLLSDQWMLEDAQHSAIVRISFVDNEINALEIIPLEIDRSTKTIQIAEGTHLRDNIFARLTGRLITNEGVKIQLLPESR